MDSLLWCVVSPSVNSGIAVVCISAQTLVSYNASDWNISAIVTLAFLLSYRCHSINTTVATFRHPDLTVTWQTSWLLLCSMEDLAEGAEEPSGAAGVQSQWVPRIRQHTAKCIPAMCLSPTACMEECMNDINKRMNMAGTVWGCSRPTVAEIRNAESKQKSPELKFIVSAHRPPYPAPTAFNLSCSDTQWEVVYQWQ